jgi:hypothetical protein
MGARTGGFARTLQHACTAGMLLVASMAVAESDTDKRLSVQLKRQHTPVWCWAAVIAMVVDYTQRFSLQDCEVLTEYDRSLGGPGLCCSAPATCLRGGLLDEMKAILSQIFGVHGIHELSPVSFRKVQTEIDAGRPLVAALRKGDAGHVVVIAGYKDERRLVVLDPMHGTNVVSYDELVASWRNGVWTDTFLFTSNRPIAKRSMCTRSEELIPGTARGRAECKSNRLPSEAAQRAAQDAAPADEEPPDAPPPCRTITLSCNHQLHPGGDASPCVHSLHPLGDQIPCQHACPTPWGGFAPCHPFDLTQCMHRLHAVDVSPCIHAAHPMGHKECI